MIVDRRAQTLQLTCFHHSIYYLAAVPGGFNNPEKHMGGV